jgi:hypothetical protein
MIALCRKAGAQSLRNVWETGGLGFSTFITSVSLLLDGSSFLSPTKGSFAAHNAQVAKVVEIATKPIARNVQGVKVLLQGNNACGSST